ncbi:MAG: beta strand repeat-containing protein, partial [Acetobacteraceae bacterium]
DLLLDPGTSLDITGHVDLGNNSQGTAAAGAAGMLALSVSGSVTANGATLNAGPTQTVSGATGGRIAIATESTTAPDSMLVENGATVIDTYSLLGSDATDTAGLTITGPATQWRDAGDPTDTTTTRGYMIIGSNDLPSILPATIPATLTVANSARLTEASFASIADTAGSAGSVDIGTAATWTIADFLAIGRAGAGNLTVNGGVLQVGPGATILSDGTRVITPWAVDIGSSAAATGTLSLSGNGNFASMIAAGEIVVGDAGTGTLNLIAGSSGAGLLDFASTGTALVIGAATGGMGVATVDGTSINVYTTVVVGASGNGTLVVRDHGNVTDGSAPLIVGGNGGSFGTVTVTGNISTVSATTVSLGGQAGGPSGGVGMITVLNGGTVQVTAALAVWADSTISLDDSSTITVGPASGTVTGAVEIQSGHSIIGDGTIAASVVNNGTIITSNSGIVANSDGGTLEIAGSVSGRGAITLGSFSTLLLDGIEDGQAITFATGGPETLVLGTPGTGFSGTISNFQNGDRIEFGDGLIISGASITSPGTVTVFTNAGQYVLGGISFAANSSASFVTGTDAITGDRFIQLAGQTFDWDAGSGNLAATANWQVLSGGSLVPASSLPGSADTAQLLGETGTLTGSGTFGLVQIGDSASTVLSGTIVDTAGVSVGAPNGTLVVVGGGDLHSIGSVLDVIGDSAGDAGAIRISGDGSNWTALGGIAVGYEGAGRLAVDTGGMVATAGSLLIADLAGSLGEVDISSNGTLESTGSFDDVGAATGATGTLTVTDPGSTYRADGQMAVGLSGQGSLLVENHGTVIAGGNTLFPQDGLEIGAATGGLGNVTVTGTGSSLGDVGELIVGGNSTAQPGGIGSLLISAGGTVST